MPGRPPHPRQLVPGSAGPSSGSRTTALPRSPDGLTAAGAPCARTRRPSCGPAGRSTSRPDWCCYERGGPAVGGPGLDGQAARRRLPSSPFAPPDRSDHHVGRSAGRERFGRAGRRWRSHAHRSGRRAVSRPRTRTRPASADLARPAPGRSASSSPTASSSTTRLFTGPSVSPAWAADDVPQQLCLGHHRGACPDGGRGTRPASTIRSAQPDLAAGHELAAALGRPNLSVVGAGRRAEAPRPHPLATVRSAHLRHAGRPDAARVRQCDRRVH